MIANYHNHTYRCHHATGTERGYIERAMSGGIKYMGFSDHIPFVFPDGKENDAHVSMADRFAYVECLTKLKEEYKDRIDIKIGYEMEYAPLLFEGMLDVAYETGVEYLILGQHFINNTYVAENVVFEPNDSVERLDIYVDQVSEGMRTGVFSYVAHPDAMNFSGDEDVYLEKMKKICETSLETGVPLELNLLGIRAGRNYPTRSFWRMVGEMGCEVVYGFDAHDRRSAYDGASLVVAEQMREEYGLNVLEIPRIIDIRKIPRKK